MTILVKSSNNHTTSKQVKIKGSEATVIEEDTKILHAEHEPLILDKGEKYLGRVVECDPLSKQIKAVQD